MKITSPVNLMIIGCSVLVIGGIFLGGKVMYGGGSSSSDSPTFSTQGVSPIPVKYLNTIYTSPAHCSNGAIDGDETDADCGGSCQPCNNGSRCDTEVDCLDDYCLQPMDASSGELRGYCEERDPATFSYHPTGRSCSETTFPCPIIPCSGCKPARCIYFCFDQFGNEHVDKACTSDATCKAQLGNGAQCGMSPNEQLGEWSNNNFYCVVGAGLVTDKACSHDQECRPTYGETSACRFIPNPNPRVTSSDTKIKSGLPGILDTIVQPKGSSNQELQAWLNTLTSDKALFKLGADRCPACVSTASQNPSLHMYYLVDKFNKFGGPTTWNFPSTLLVEDFTELLNTIGTNITIPWYLLAVKNGNERTVSSQQAGKYVNEEATITNESFVYNEGPLITPDPNRTTVVDKNADRGKKISGIKVRDFIGTTYSLDKFFNQGEYFVVYYGNSCSFHSDIAPHADAISEFLDVEDNGKNISACSFVALMNQTDGQCAENWVSVGSKYKDMEYVLQRSVEFDTYEEINKFKSTFLSPTGKTWQVKNFAIVDKEGKFVADISSSMPDLSICEPITTTGNNLQGGPSSPIVMHAYIQPTQGNIFLDMQQTCTDLSTCSDNPLAGEANGQRCGGNSCASSQMVKGQMPAWGAFCVDNTGKLQIDNSGKYVMCSSDSPEMFDPNNPANANCQQGYLCGSMPKLTPLKPKGMEAEQQNQGPASYGPVGFQTQGFTTQGWYTTSEGLGFHNEIRGRASQMGRGMCVPSGIDEDTLDVKDYIGFTTTQWQPGKGGNRDAEMGVARGGDKVEIIQGYIEEDVPIILEQQKQSAPSAGAGSAPSAGAGGSTLVPSSSQVGSASTTTTTTSPTSTVVGTLAGGGGGALDSTTVAGSPSGMSLETLLERLKKSGVDTNLPEVQDIIKTFMQSTNKTTFSQEDARSIRQKIRALYIDNGRTPLKNQPIPTTTAPQTPPTQVHNSADEEDTISPNGQEENTFAQDNKSILRTTDAVPEMILDEIDKLIATQESACIYDDVDYARVNFNDIDDDRAKHAIQALRDFCIVKGRDPKNLNTFAPDSRISRAEFIKIVVKVFGLADSTKKPAKEGTPYTGPAIYMDVGPNHWAAHYIAQAKGLGLLQTRIQQNGSNRFFPNQSVTKEDIAKILTTFPYRENVQLTTLLQYISSDYPTRSEIATIIVKNHLSLFRTYFYLQGGNLAYLQQLRQQLDGKTKDEQHAYLTSEIATMEMHGSASEKESYSELEVSSYWLTGLLKKFVFMLEQ